MPARRTGIDAYCGAFHQTADAVSQPDLFPEITERSVDRRPFQMRSLTTEQKHQLGQALNQDMEIQWYESLSDRVTIAGLSGLATTIPVVHSRSLSPSIALLSIGTTGKAHTCHSFRGPGLDPVTLRLTRWSMASWGRTRFMIALGAPSFRLFADGFPAGTVLRRLFCHSPASGGPQIQTLTQTIRAGQAIQRASGSRQPKLGVGYATLRCNSGFLVLCREKISPRFRPPARPPASLLGGPRQCLVKAMTSFSWAGLAGPAPGSIASVSVRRPLGELLGVGDGTLALVDPDSVG